MITNENAVAKNESPRAERFLVPAVDILEEKEGYRLLADMPGVSKDKLEITVDNRELTIIGKLAEKVSGEGISLFPAYKRSFVLNEEIETKEINASIENGVLTLTLPKSEKVKPRKIEIKTA